MGHIGDGFLRVNWPNQQCQITDGRQGPMGYSLKGR